MQLVAAMVEVYDYDYDQYESSSPVVDPSEAPPEEYDETGTRNTWAVLTWIMLALTILLNLVLIGILVVKRNLRSITNKSESNYFLQLWSAAPKKGRARVLLLQHWSDITSEESERHIWSKSNLSSVTTYM